MEGKYCRVQFRVHCETKLGQTVGLYGSTYSLGFQDKTKIIHLVTTPDSYPVWYSDVPILFQCTDLEISYKYCLVEGGKAKSFENSFRKLTTSNREDVTVEDIVIGDSFNGVNEDDEGELLSGIERLKQIHDRYTSEDSAMGASSRVVIVCYHLPVSISRTSDSQNPFTAKWSESLIAKSSNSISEKRETSWFGTVDTGNVPLTKEETVYLTNLLKGMNCFPVFIDKETTSLAYLGFCKGVLWPIFHNIDQLDQIHASWKLSEQQKSGNESLDWNENTAPLIAAYKSTNEAFFGALKPYIRADDVIWVHDYHLMLLPKLLRDVQSVNFSIVFFLHLPFPTSQIFRTLPMGSELLYSMVCADLVGFHSFDHARHFLNAAKRILGIRSYTRQGGMLTLKVKDREVIVTMSHVSIEPDLVASAVSNPAVQKKAEELKKTYKGRKIIVGVDVCQRLSGGSLKLAAYEKLLTDYPNLLGRVVLVQKSLRPNNRVQDEEATSVDLLKMVDSLNSKFSHENEDPVVDYTEVSSLNLHDRVALWLAADVFLLTSIREGLNLLPLEYVYARKDLDYAGVVVASEYTACSSLLSGSLKVNPFYTLNVSDTLHRALEMTGKDCAQRLQRDLPFVANHPSSKWTQEILSDLQSVIISNEKSKSLSLAMKPKEINCQHILKMYKAANEKGIATVGRRVFVFDYGGTLLQKEKFDLYIKHTLSAIAGRKPTDKVLDAVRVLSQDPQNIVMVLTGLTKVKLGDVFENMQNVIVATSSGLIYSWGELLVLAEDDLYEAETQENNPGQDKLYQRKWGCLDFNIDWEAVRNIAVPIMTKFMFRTNGSCLSPRFPGIGWSFFGADPEWGESQAKQLQVELEAALAYHDVKITSQIQGSIEIVPKALNKGLIVKLLLRRVLAKRGGQLPHFAMIIGDEPSDDKMFDALYETMRDIPEGAGVKNLDAFTIMVGPRESNANFQLNDVQVSLMLYFIILVTLF